MSAETQKTLSTKAIKINYYWLALLVQINILLMPVIHKQNFLLDRQVLIGENVGWKIKCCLSKNGLCFKWDNSIKIVKGKLQINLAPYLQLLTQV